MYFRLSSALDFINLLSYDLHGQWEPVTGHHTALYPGSTDVGDNAFLTVVSDSKSVENLSNFTELISTQKSLQTKHNNSASVRTKEKKKKKNQITHQVTHVPSVIGILLSFCLAGKRYRYLCWLYETGSGVSRAQLHRTA